MPSPSSCEKGGRETTSSCISGVSVSIKVIILGAIKQQIINRFDGGIADSSREQNTSKCAMVKHFDIHAGANRLVPYRETEVDTLAEGITDARHFIYTSNGNSWAMAKNASNQPQLVYKTLANLATNNWANADAAPAFTRITGCFFEWQQELWYFAGTLGSTVKVYKTNYATGITQVGTTSNNLNTTAQGIIGGNNNAYMFYDNHVIKIDGNSAITDDQGPILPSDMRITCSALWGNYIAIGMAYGKNAADVPSGRSLVFLWDKDSTTATSEVIDWGEGSLQVLGNVEGELVGVTDKYMSDTSGLGKGAMVIRKWNGGNASVVKEVIVNNAAVSGRFLQESVVRNNKLYWVASVPLNQSTSVASTHHLGIWCYGRKTIAEPQALSLDTIEDGIDTDNYQINSFGNIGNYWVFNHGASGSEIISRTNDTAVYPITSTGETPSIYESLILDEGSVSQKKKLIGITATYEPLPENGQVTLKYRKDEETSYTAIFTDTTDNSLSHSAVNIESTGVTLPTYKEIQFRIESEGGAVITGIKWKYEIISDDIY